MKHLKLFSMSSGHFGKAVLFLLLSCLTMTAQATVTGSYDSSTKTLTFSGDGQLTQVIIQDTPGFSEATSAVIEDGVTSITEYAFQGCNTLVSVSIAGTVTSIGYNAFLNCKNLANIRLESGTSTLAIGARAFEKSSTNTTNVEFYCARNFTYTTLEDDAAYYQGIFYESSHLTKLVVGPNVKAFPTKSFYKCPNLTTVDMSGASDLDYISDQCFYHCSNLTTVDLSGASKLKSIESYAFYECKNLATLNMNGASSLEYIYQYAFAYCCALTSISIPGSVGAIHEGAFFDIKDTQKITFESGSSPLIVGALAFLQNAPMTTTFEFDCDRTFQYTTTSGDAASYQGIFSNSYYLTKVTLGPNVSSFPEHSFEGCSRLTSLDFTNASSLTTIPQSAFKECIGLTVVYFPASVTYVDNVAFNDCTNLTLAVFEGTATMSANAFPAETTIRSLKTLTYDEWLAGYTDKSSVTELYIPGDCIANYSGYTNNANLHHQFPNVKKLVFGEKVTTLSTNIFSSNTGTPNTILETVVFNSNVKVGQNAFQANSNLSSVNTENIVECGKRCFLGCSSLKSLNLTSCTTIEGNAFKDCTGLNEVTLGSALTSTIGENAFYNTNVQTLNINSNTLTSATYTAESTLADIFGDNLETVVIGDAVTTIGDYAFYGCDNLYSITIGKNVTSLASTAFQDCCNPMDIDIESNAVASNDFPDGQWTMFDYISQHDINNLVFGSEVTKIGEYAFDGSWNQCSVLNVTFKGNPDHWCPLNGLNLFFEIFES